MADDKKLSNEELEQKKMLEEALDLDAKVNSSEDTSKEEQDKEVPPEQKPEGSEEFNIDLNKLSKKTVNFFKQASKQILKKEEENKELQKKGIYKAYNQGSYIHQFFSSRQNLSLTCSVLALALAAISFVSNSSGPDASKFVDSANVDITSTEFDEHLAKMLTPEDVEKIFNSKFSTSVAQIVTPQIDSKIDAALKDFKKDLAKEDLTVNAEGKQRFNIKDWNTFKEKVKQAQFEVTIDSAKAEIDRLTKFKKENLTKMVPDNRKIYGDPKARFLIQEFSDVECPYCQRFFDVPKEVVDVSQGNVALEFIHSPLSFHDPIASFEAKMANCVFNQKGNPEFWKALNWLFKKSRGNAQGVPNEVFETYVGAFGLDYDKYLQCINDPKEDEKVKKDVAYAQASGVQGTPAILITDTQTGVKKLLGGAQPKENIMKAIDELNNKSDKPAEGPAKSQETAPSEQQ